jgi:hypothetical protein
MSEVLSNSANSDESWCTVLLGKKESVPKINYLLQHVCLSNEELESIVPGQEDTSNDLLDTFLLELESLGSDNRRVDEIKSQGVSSKLVDDNARLGIILEALAHLLAIANTS